jgi:ZIP family zinc transporter
MFFIHPCPHFPPDARRKNTRYLRHALCRLTLALCRGMIPLGALIAERLSRRNGGEPAAWPLDPRSRRRRPNGHRCPGPRARRQQTFAAISVFVLGGVVFAITDRLVKTCVGPKGQLLALLADFIPEAMALGTLPAAGSGSATPHVLLIAIQNLPEGFNAYCEANNAARTPPRKTLFAFVALAFLGPVAVIFGLTVLAGRDGTIGGLILFAAGGALYLIFEDIAPKTPIENELAPPLETVAGFILGLAGRLLI